MPHTSGKAYCKERQAFVSIPQGMETCIADHQCFSDDPCPLREKFIAQESAAQVAAAFNTQAKGHAPRPAGT